MEIEMCLGGASKGIQNLLLQRVSASFNELPPNFQRSFTTLSLNREVSCS